ncbi:uncharacterized protein LOC26526057 [Drosophila erecta]|uniref:Uncharacterized protein n=1 Tax=Drosophila erecta TaxID=7220 RepID=A0A0Q5VM82_DROER|nr:uncharacterized protein LOC26526057 [Drosophila erecta]XP_026835649.1 uncharacterized protein LOC26526057 [Drosophila erecta]KQS62656.1 uncharacterized protein Dere_GG26233 [Drosophila erecta]
MICRKCCFCLPLKVGVIIIGAIFIIFHVGELIAHSDNTIFIRQVSHKIWAPLIMSPILTIGTLSSVLLVYAASKQKKRGFVLMWIIVYTVILFLYCIMGIVDVAIAKPAPAVLVVQLVIILGLLYSLMIVLAYYRYLSTVVSDDAI